MNNEFNHGNQIYSPKVSPSRSAGEQFENKYFSETMEIEWQNNKKLFRKIFEEIHDGIIIWNSEMQIVELNHAAEAMFNLPKERLKNRFFYEVAPEKEKEKMIRHIRQVLQNGSGNVSLYFDDIKGKEGYFEVSSRREITRDLNFSVFKDISEKVEMQRQLQNSGHLKAVGELAAGIAHEIRNPMTALKGFIQLLEGSIKAKDAMYYQVITSELSRIDSIINEFLILAKPQEIRFRLADIKKILRETVELLNPQAVLYQIQFSIRHEGEIPLIYCEPNQLKKVFINLLKNAIEVMPNGGLITILTKRINEDQIQISIRDEGKGIPKEQMTKLGEPFYTTKESGTGLGLMVSYKIIEDHHGCIKVDSVEGKGTTFHIILPLGFQ